jgi:hypothetical protein
VGNIFAVNTDGEIYLSKSRDGTAYNPPRLIPQESQAQAKQNLLTSGARLS